MAGYKHNHQAGINPWAVGRVVSPLRDWGVGMPGRLAPIQGEPGQAAILTHVVDWPWAEDDQGVPFDQDNIWGVRTRSTIDVDGNETDWLVAVPKILPSGYTPVGRHGRIVPFIADHLGYNPFLGRVDLFDAIDPVRWRTPTGQYPTDLTDDGYLWLPMNLNQQTYETSPPPGSWYVTYDEGTFTFTTWGKTTIDDHVGFRGLSFTGTAYAGMDPPAAAGTYTLMVAYSDPDDGEPTTIDDVTILWEMDMTAVDGEYIIEEDLFPAVLTGRRMDYHLITRYLTYPGLGGSSSWTWPALSPRTDIPLWYWASTRNRVAPGGVILP